MAVQRITRASASAGALALAVAVLLGAAPARADKIKNGTAVFSGLDKITGRIISFKAAMGETVQFGSLQVTARACYTRPPTEAPQTDTFVEVDEVSASSEYKRIFSGWMFAASPGLHGIEHPIYDIWLTGCKSPGETIVDAPQTADAESARRRDRAGRRHRADAGAATPPCGTPPVPRRRPSRSRGASLARRRDPRTPPRRRRGRSRRSASSRRASIRPTFRRAIPPATH